MKTNNKTRPPEAENELWLPPLSHKTEEELARLRKTIHKAQEAEEVEVTRARAKTRLFQRFSSKKSYQSIKKGLTRFWTGLYRLLGFKGKGLWDWLPLLLGLVGILVIAFAILTGLAQFTVQGIQEQQVLSQQQLQTQKLLAQQQLRQQQLLATQIPQYLTPLVKQVGGVVDQQHDLALTTYLDYISALLISRSAPLLQAPPGSIERMLAQTRTLAILTDLSTDSLRKGIVIQFLHDSGLILAHVKNGPIIQLATLDLSGINLSAANLASVDFDGVILTGANLSGATLTAGSLRGAVLTKANFGLANLQNADLGGANMETADLTGAIMKGANLAGADTKNIKQVGTVW